jgi:putative transposase
MAGWAKSNRCREIKFLPCPDRGIECGHCCGSQPTATCRLLFVLVILAHERRRIVHVAVTDHPTAAWTVQQLREAFPWDRAPRYLIRARDHAFDGWAHAAKALSIEEVLTAARAPWQNAYVERFIGSARRE